MVVYGCWQPFLYPGIRRPFFIQFRRKILAPATRTRPVLYLSAIRRDQRQRPSAYDDTTFGHAGLVAPSTILSGPQLSPDHQQPVSDFLPSVCGGHQGTAWRAIYE